jgi:D-3-phosphoglycerate dehydrogenase
MFKGKTGPLTVTRAGPRHEITEDEACEKVKGATVIVVFPGSTNLTKRILESAEKIGFIQSFGVGYDNIDIATATELGIPVANNPGWNANSVAEHTIMLILMTLKNALKINRLNMDGTFTLGKRRSMLPLELKDRTLGLIGLGNIGREVARLAGAFGSKVIYYKRNRLSEEAEHRLSVEYRPFQELLAESDIVSIHVPLTDETRGMIGSEEIEMMKDGATLINTAREHIMGEEAVAEALKSGKLSGVGVDTIPMEIEDGFFVHDSPLPTLENVVFTPHIAGTSKEALIRADVMWVENVCRFLNGEKPLHIVNDVWPTDS